MTPVQLAAAIKAELGLPEEVAGAVPIAQAAAKVMGIEFEFGSTLPVMLAKLAGAIGIAMTSPEVLAAERAPTAETETPVRVSTAEGRRRPTASSGSSSRSSAPPSNFPPPPSSQRQSSLLSISGISKQLLPKAQLDAYRERQVDGEAVSDAMMHADVAMEVNTLPTEQEWRRQPPPPKPAFGCVTCGKSFGRAVALCNHRLWKHPTQPRQVVAMPARVFRGSLSASLAVGPDGAVGVTVLVNGKTRAQLVSDAEADERAADAAREDREREANRRRQRELLLREAEEELGEQRRGSEPKPNPDLG